MDYLALATDYDGTLAHHGAVARETIAALERLRSSGRKLILVTGRELPDLQSVFPGLDIFDSIVAENGALLYLPPSKEKCVLAAAPDPRFVEALRRRGVHPLSVGASIVATCEPYETVVLDTIRELGLEMQVIFNKGSVMVLPSGVNKKTGLEAALARFAIPPEQVAGIGDAENDQSLLKFCGWSVAVANALPALKQIADFTTNCPHGEGVRELIGMMLAGHVPKRG